MKNALCQLLCVLCMLSAASAAARPLGRLFFTDDERAALDRPPAPAAADEAPAATPRQPVRFDGLLRIDGRSARWFVNGEALNADDLRARGLSVPTSAPPCGLSMPRSGGGSTLLRAGQTADVDTAGHAHAVSPDAAVQRTSSP
ncbi:hypothetical protein [Methyloversatilis thermotolerans]|uniref:hypothetical protein n=1 Tax=Methyloversatilis thermotolerans TaxID=1346290 RepID=UPI000379DA56|nr:hypothetical protein [Methyloversatilis thermotolerans]